MDRRTFPHAVTTPAHREAATRQRVNADFGAVQAAEIFLSLVGVAPSRKPRHMVRRARNLEDELRRACASDKQMATLRAADVKEKAAQHA